MLRWKYADFPVVEWTVHLRNTGEESTPIIEDIQALDTRLERGGDGEFLLHHSDGSPHSGLAPQTPTQYAPRETELPPGAETRLAAMEGLPAGGDLPYFNVECNGEGIIFAVGWLGQWAAQFSRDNANGLDLRVGQELTHFRLMPGEEVRTPLIAMLFWEGGWIRSQNLWRRWMIRHNLPRPGGKLPPPQLEAGGSAQYIEMSLATEENQIEFVDRYFEEKIEIDYWWMDAGWYIFRDYWLSLGTWEPDPERFPRGLRPISDHVHSKGAKVILWFVPERADPGEWLYETIPNGCWELTGAGNFSTLVTPKRGSGQLITSTHSLSSRAPISFEWMATAPSPFGGLTTPKTAKELRKSDTLRVSWHFGMNCGGAIPIC